MKRIGIAIVVPTALALGMLPSNMQAAVAAPPGNDALRHAIEIASVPFLHREDTSEATASGPTFCGNNSSVFFEFTPAEDVSVQADTFGSGYDTTLGVFTGTHDAVNPIACSDDAVGLWSAVRLDAQAGTTYSFEVSSCCGSGEDKTGGHLEFSLTEAPTTRPRVAVEFSATLRPGRIVRLRGTVTCDQRAGVEVFGTLRQLVGDFVAKGFFDTFPPLVCRPDAANTFAVYVDTETSAAFDEGRAALRYDLFASNGARSVSQTGIRTTVRIVRS
jgi:hypothetical protein